MSKTQHYIFIWKYSKMATYEQKIMEEFYMFFILYNYFLCTILLLLVLVHISPR